MKALLGSLALLMATSVSVVAQTYPSKPIRIIVPVAAGSVTDIITRAAGQQLDARFGQRVVVENRGGASGILGARECANASPDGHTLCMVYHNTLSFNPFLFTKLPYDADKDFVPITRLFFLTEGLIVPTAQKIGSVAELRAFAAKNPDSLNFGTLGSGSLPELFLRWLNNQWNARIAPVPFTGGGPVAQAVSANHIQLAMIGAGNFMGLREAGSVRVLAVARDQRSPMMPEVPTFKEAGLGDYPGVGWWGIAAPRGTPEEAIERVHAEFVKLFNEPQFQGFLAKQIVVPSTTTRAEFMEFLRKDREAARNLIRIADTKPKEFKPN
jgi:tripartite-type tricarboxylate transporter receptor subunit TctC